MAGIEIKVAISDQEVKDLLQKMQDRGSDMTPAFKIIGEIVRRSIWKNFTSGGRPNKWLPNKPATLKKKKGASPLIGQGMAGGLMGSITYAASRDRVEIGSPKVYAAIHQLGGQAGRGLEVTIPARPYLMVQDEDWDAIKEAITTHLKGL